MGVSRGKDRAGETSEQALARELSEELGISANHWPAHYDHSHTYRNGGAIEIEFFRIAGYEGELVNHIFQQMQWSPVTAYLSSTSGRPI